MAAETHLITQVASLDDVTYWMHYPDHADLDPVQRQAVRHLRESLQKLIRHRDKVDEVRHSFTKSAFTGAPEGDARDHENLHEATVNFFQTYYATISALSSFIIRIARLLKVDSPSANSVGKFIRWMAEERRNFLPIDAELAKELERARAFRALIDHPASSQPYEWGIYNGDIGFVHRLMYYGPMKGDSVPSGATAADGPLGEGGWIFAAPDEVSITNALMNVVVLYMPIVRGNIPPAPDGVTCPDFSWERERNGDQPVYSEPRSFYLPDSARVRLDTMGSLHDVHLTKAAARGAQ